MRFVRSRPILAFLFATLWIGWAVWANVPHYYDAQAMEKEIAVVLGPNNVNLQPASAGFPFDFMRYDYSNDNQLTVYDAELSALLPNILFSLAGALGIALLVARTRRISFPGIALLCCLLLPAVLLYFLLNGLNPDVISYVYLTPLMLLLVSLPAEMAQKRKGKNHAMQRSGGSATTNGASWVAAR